jgi:hypothetical protein
MDRVEGNVQGKHAVKSGPLRDSVRNQSSARHTTRSTTTFIISKSCPASSAPSFAGVVPSDQSKILCDFSAFGRGMGLTAIRSRKYG